jgi:hypothetical protein
MNAIIGRVRVALFSAAAEFRPSPREPADALNLRSNRASFAQLRGGFFFGEKIVKQTSGRSNGRHGATP